MKTAISIPSPLFQAAEKYAKRMNKTRSQLFAEAITEYLQKHVPDEVTRALNETIDAIGADDDAFIQQASHHILEGSEW